MRWTGIVVIGLAIAVLLSVWSITEAALAFNDVPDDHPYAGAVNELARLDIVSGRSDGTFRPDDAVNRAQFAKMIIGALGIVPNTSTDTRFTDLGSPDAAGYPHRYVQTAYDSGITYGTNVAQTLFAPWGPIRREQAVSMVVRAVESLSPGTLRYPPSGTATYFSNEPEPHGTNLRVAQYNGLLDGLAGMGWLERLQQRHSGRMRSDALQPSPAAG